MQVYTARLRVEGTTWAKHLGWQMARFQCLSGHYSTEQLSYGGAGRRTLGSAARPRGVVILTALECQAEHKGSEECLVAGLGNLWCYHFD